MVSPTGKKLPLLDILLTVFVLLSVGLLGVQGQSTTLSASLSVFLLSKYPTEQSRPPSFSSWSIVIKCVLRVSVCSVARVSLSLAVPTRSGVENPGSKVLYLSLRVVQNIALHA